MNTFKLVLLLLALIAAINLTKAETAVKLVKADLVDGGVVEHTGKLIVPTLLKWDAPLTNTNKSGVVVLRIKGMRFLYKRSEDVYRNEYKLVRAYVSEIGVVRGDSVEIDFTESNMAVGGSVRAMLKVEK